MERIPGLRRLIRHDPTPERVRRDVDEEIAYHLDAVTAELTAAGMTPAEARRRAEERFGDVERHRQALRAVDQGGATQARWLAGVRDAASDLRYALRGLVREPMFALGAITTLAIGLAANATMFGVIDRLLLRPPPHVRDDPRLSLIYLSSSDGAGRNRTRTSTSYPDYAMFRDSSGVVEGAAAFWVTQASLGRGEAARKVQVGLASGEFFDLLGARPALGRWFGAAEDDPAATELPAVLSHAQWRGQFAGDPAIIGRAIRVDMRTYTVIGVAPAGFHGPQSRRVDIWVPLRAVAADYVGNDWQTSRNMYWLRMVARRRPDVPPDQAGQRATLVHQRANRVAQQGDSSATIVFGSIVPARGAGIARGTGGGVMNGGQAGMSPQGRVAAWLGGVAAVVLLIVCANLANLLLSRASRRRREIAVRLAIGIRRGRLVRQMLGETLLLVLVGGAAGVVLAHWGGALMRATLLPDVAWEGSAVDLRVVTFTLAACVVASVIAGLAPALVASRQDLAHALRGTTGAGGTRRTRLQRTLLVSQAALSVVLLAGAGLFIRSLHNVATLRLGYDADQVLVANIDVTGMVRGAAEVNRFYDEAAAQLRAVPGVSSVSVAVTTPFASSWVTSFAIPGRDSLPELRGDGPYINAVTNEFLTTMGTRIVRGRGFATTDVSGAERVAVVNQYMAETLWPAGDALGKCVKVGADTAPCTTVVGIAENAYRDDLRESAAAQYLVLLGQATWDSPGMRSLFIRAAGDADHVATVVRRQLQGLRPDLPYADVRALRRIIEPGMQEWKLGATMFGLFGGIALLVAAIGLYAVVAYDVAQRQHEMGVRSALGARPGHLLGLVVGDGVGHALVGLGLGVAIAWLAAPLARDLLFRVGPRDVTTYAAVAGVLLVAASIACALPAWRASRVSPADVLRAE